MIEWLNGIFSDSVKVSVLSALKGVIEIIPDIIGYSALATGAFVILSSLVGNGIMKPLGYFAAVSIVAVSILGVM